MKKNKNMTLHKIDDSLGPLVEKFNKGFETLVNEIILKTGFRGIAEPQYKLHPRIFYRKINNFGFISEAVLQQYFSDGMRRVEIVPDPEGNYTINCLQYSNNEEEVPLTVKEIKVNYLNDNHGIFNKNMKIIQDFLELNKVPA